MLRPAPHGPPRRPHLPAACPAGSSQTQTLPARAGPQGPYGGECHDDAGDRLPGATPWGLTPKSELRAPGPGSFGSHALLTRPGPQSLHTLLRLLKPGQLGAKTRVMGDQPGMQPRGGLTPPLFPLQSPQKSQACASPSSLPHLTTQLRGELPTLCSGSSAP